MAFPGLRLCFAIKLEGDVSPSGRHQDANTPNGGGAHPCHEDHTQQPSGNITFAPALEHSGESSQKEDDAHHTQRLEPHIHFSLAIAWQRICPGESTPVTALRDVI